MKITMAQINTVVGDLVGNADKIISIVNDRKEFSDIIVFPELTLTGYPPLDLIERKGFCEEQLAQLARVVEATRGSKAGVVVGFFEPNTGVGKPFFNSLAFISNGIVLHKYHKRLLPTYNIFDEHRHFEPGDRAGVVRFNGLNIGLLICEDMWNDKAITDKFIYPINPVEETAQHHPDLLISINASPSNVGKPEYRLEKFSGIVKEYGIPLVYVNQVGGNDDLVFDGTSFAIDAQGNVLEVLGSFEEKYFTVEMKLEKGKFILGYKDALDERDSKKWLASGLWKMEPSEFYFKQIVLGIKDYVRKCGFKKAVIASSGGIDSALVLALAVEALGAENVEAITMPSAISSAGSVDDSVVLCRNLGVKLHTYPIAETVNQMLNVMGVFVNKWDDLKSLTKENLQARIRGTVLMAFTNQFPEFLPLTTGNKSECAVGYCTIYGDMNGGLAPISDLYKTEVWALSRFINTYKGKEVIPYAIIDKEPSAELYEGQKDQDSLPPYDVLDAVLIPYIEGNEIDPKILKQCSDIVAKAGFKDFSKIHRMVDRSEFKRRQAAPTIRVHAKAWGSGRRMPIAQRHSPSNVLV